MYIKFIGSCDANPDYGRAHSEIILHIDSKNYLFDCGDGIPLSMMNELKPLSPQTNLYIATDGMKFKF